MRKYLRLLRIQDQYPEFGFSLAAGLSLNTSELWIVQWAFATVFLSFPAYILNELVDSRDTDRYSWNPVHIKNADRFNKVAVGLMLLASSFIGLILAANINLVFWGLLMLVVGVLYSLKPVRLKTVPFLDVLAQLLVWFVIPFIAPIIKAGYLPYIPFVISGSMLVFFTFIPYQIADIKADRKAGIKGLHTILGVNNTLYLSATLGTLGVLIYFLSNSYQAAPWAIFAAPSLAYIGYYYYKWIKTADINEKIISMQRQVKIVKPATRIMALLILLAFLVF